jgi:photosynthetic reaction center cytochrome c subunit
MSSENQSVPEGAIAKYDERQRSILRGEVAGLIAATILALGGVIAVSIALADVRTAQGYRAESQYNYAGVQRVDYVTYLQSQGREVVRPSAEAIQAYNVWAAANPNTKNVQVLTKYFGDKYNDTAAVFGYMSQFVTPGVGVSCEYCHNLQDFSVYDKPTKDTAKAMLTMNFELQNKWVATTPKPEGQPAYQLKCASCHNGQPKFWNNGLALSVREPVNLGKAIGVYGSGYPTFYDNKNLGLTLNGKPQPFYSFVDDAYLAAKPDANGQVNFFQVTANRETEPGLVDTFRNQYAMNHQNNALGVGCDFCHYGGYFKSYVLEDGTFKWPKSQAKHMQSMVQDIAINWLPQMPNVIDYAQPNCYMCHRGNVVPPGDVDTINNEVPAKVSDPLIKPLSEIPVPPPVLPQQ